MKNKPRVDLPYPSYTRTRDRNVLCRALRWWVVHEEMDGPMLEGFRFAVEVIARYLFETGEISTEERERIETAWRSGPTGNQNHA